MITMDDAMVIATSFFSKKGWVIDSIKQSRNPELFFINAAPKDLYEDVHHNYSKIIGIPRYVINRKTKQIKQLSFYDLCL